jgi:transglutaminase-like putative cysteine protease
MVRKGRSQSLLLLIVILAVTVGITNLAGEACIPRDDKMAEPALDIPRSSAERPDDVEHFVQPADPLVRDVAVSAVRDCPPDIEANDEIWKIWQINRWVALNISYVSDPLRHNYFAYARETIDAGGGDCDDFAILLASMYESVGLDAAIASIDTVGDRKTDHMTCLVYYPGEGEMFVDEEKEILGKMGMSIDVRVICFDTANSRLLPPKYTGGVWIVTDPTMAVVKEKVGYVAHKPYQAILVIDVGN